MEASFSASRRLLRARWVEPLVPNNPSAPIHPNLHGMEGGAAVLVSAVKSG
jgi:hypothetical protein